MIRLSCVPFLKHNYSECFVFLFFFPKCLDDDKSVWRHCIKNLILLFSVDFDLYTISIVFFN